MSDQIKSLFTPEQISQFAIGNLNSLCCVATAYQKEQGHSPDDFWTFVGHKYSQGWKKGMSANEIGQGVALNMVSAGCELQSLTGDSDSSEVVLGNWPSQETLDFSAISQLEADTIWLVFETIADNLGYRCHWQRDGDAVTISISK